MARVLGELQKSDLQKRLEWMLGNHHGKAPPAFVDGFRKEEGAGRYAFHLQSVT